MSQTLDANILVYSSDEGSPLHDRARSLIEQLAAESSLLVVFWPTLLGFLRIATHPSIFNSPLSYDDAMGNVKSLLDRPQVRVAGEDEDFWTHYEHVASELRPRGNLVPDTHLVALMREHGISTIWSHDRDFRKFSGITVCDPFDVRYSAGFD